MHHFEKKLTLVVNTPIKKENFSRLRLRLDSLVRAQRSIDHVYFRIEVRENLLPDAEAEVGDGGAPSAEREPPGRAGRPAGWPSPAPGPVGSLQIFGKFLQNFARFRLYRHRFLQVNTKYSKYRFCSIF